MPVYESFIADPRVWISVFAVLVSVCSAFFSWRSSRNSTRALAISEGQEKRREPQIGFYLEDNYRHMLPTKQVFRFLVSLSNPTDINNAIARAELQITYVAENDVTSVCRINHNPALEQAVQASLKKESSSVISIPLRIDAHQTVSGWLLFALDHDIIRTGTVDAHRLILEDSHGKTTETDDIMVREWVA